MLAINTAFMMANLGLKSKEGHVVLKDIDAKSKHSENVLKTIDEMCQEANIDILDVDTVAVVTGPGSFTGLRIGVAIAKALGSVNKDLKFVSMSSLELMAYIIAKRKLADGDFVCALNALSNLYFVAYFSKDGIKLEEERMIGQDEFALIDKQIFGLSGDLKETKVETIEIECRDVLDFAEELAKQNRFVTEKDLLPIYLRPSQAEDNLLKKSKKD